MEYCCLVVAAKDDGHPETCDQPARFKIKSFVTGDDGFWVCADHYDEFMKDEGLWQDA